MLCIKQTLKASLAKLMSLEQDKMKLFNSINSLILTNYQTLTINEIKLHCNLKLHESYSATVGFSINKFSK